jgi:hypothetical protein
MPVSARPIVSLLDTPKMKAEETPMDGVVEDGLEFFSRLLTDMPKGNSRPAVDFQRREGGS